MHHTVFANKRREIVLGILDSADEPVSIESLARRILEHERDGTGVDSTDDVEAVVLTLYHSHLPLLSEHELVEYDREAGTVSITQLGRERLQAERSLERASRENQSGVSRPTAQRLEEHSSRQSESDTGTR